MNENLNQDIAPSANPVSQDGDSLGQGADGETQAAVKAGNKGKNAKFSDELFWRVIERIRNGAFTREAVEAEGIHHSTFYHHLNDRPDYSDALKASQLCGPVSTAEAELFRRGVKGYLKPVYQQGRKVGTIREFSDVALIFYLKTNHPAKYAAPDSTVAISTLVTTGRGIDIRSLLNTETESEKAAVELFKARRAKLDSHTLTPPADSGAV